MSAHIDDEALEAEFSEEMELAKEYGDVQRTIIPRRSYDSSIFWLSFAKVWCFAAY